MPSLRGPHFTRLLERGALRSTPEHFGWGWASEALTELGLWQFSDIGEGEPGLATRDQLSLLQSTLPAWGPCHPWRSPHSKFYVCL